MSFSLRFASYNQPETFSRCSPASLCSCISRSCFTFIQCSSFCFRASAIFSRLLASSFLMASILALWRSTSLFLRRIRYLISKSSAVLSLILTRLSSSWRMQISCSIRTTLRQQYSMSLSGTSIIRYPIIYYSSPTSYNIIMLRITSALQLPAYAYSQLTTYTRRGKHRPALNLNVGDTIGSFRLNSRDFYKDFQMTHLDLQHQSGTKLHHLQCSEENNTLSFLFRTPGNVKKGVNLALERLLLCGSKKYAVRDLISQASMRSFSRVVPSQTTDQYLMFSFNSPIRKDFSNLLNVYCSMLFDPLLRREDYQEVVRRFTFQNERLGFSGDLAGQLFDAQFQLDQTVYSLIGEELLGSDHQGLCKALDLAHLSFEDVMQHYKKTVTLPNCTLILHGDINPHYFAEQFDRNVEQFKLKSIVQSFNNNKLQPEKLNLPKTINFQHLRQQAILMLSFRIDGATDQEITLLQILSYLLFDMPESPFMRFNSPQTPYPPLYGFRQRYFNIGFSFIEELSKDKVEGSVEWFREKQKNLIDKEAELFKAIKDSSKRLDDRMVQRCLMHLEGNYYDPKGINIIDSITERLLQGRKLTSALEVTALVSKLLRSFRKEETFEKLIQKFLIQNNNYIVLRGFNNPHIIEYEHNRNRSLLIQMQNTLTPQRINEISNFTPASFLQDTASLPSVAPSQLQSFEDLPGEEVTIGKVRTVFNQRHFGNRFTFKFDVTDLGDEDIPILALFCKAFPRMGYKTMKKESYQGLIQNYISRLDMNHQTVRDADGGLKVYAYLTIQFVDRNHEYAFSLLNGLLTDFDHNNLMALSKAIQDSASECFHDVSDNLLHYHGVHLAASRSPYAFFESPIYQARTLCALAADAKKVANPKKYLIALSRKFQQIWRKMMGWSRTQVLWECRKEKKSFYHKYLGILLKQIENEGIRPESIDVSTFPGQKWQKYYPNYDTEMAFEAFTVPYRTTNSPAALVLSSLINHSISTYNHLGGCFLFKGSLVAFIQGGRQKYLQLEDHYRRIDDLDIAKRKIFQSFNRYTVLQQFKNGITFEQARFFKEAVIAVDRPQVQEILETHLLKEIKKGTSSLLALGPKLQNYEPLMKKGWQIQRSIDDVSLAMESLSRQEITFRCEKYIDIC